MKKLLLLLFLLCTSAVFISSQNFVSYPPYAQKDVSSLELAKVECTPVETKVFLKYTSTKKGYAVSINKKTYLRDVKTGEKYTLLQASIPIAPRTYTFKYAGEVLEFTLKFPPIPESTEIVDLIENDKRIAFNFFGIDLKEGRKIALQKNRLPVDTIYYDKSGMGVQSPALAEYYRVVVPPNDSSYQRKVRDYYITGELRSENGFMNIDKSDDSKSILHGESIIYYKSGKIKEKGTRNKGKQVGEYTSYYENGLLNTHGRYYDGQLVGIYTEFFADGHFWMQMEYLNGEPRFDYYTVFSKEGYSSKFDIKDKTPIWDKTSLEDQKQEYKDGTSWLYYTENGCMVSMTTTKVKDYGKYYKVSIVLANNSILPFNFDPEEIQASLTDKKGRIQDLRVYSADEYINRVKSKQNRSVIFWSVVGGLAAVGAGYSTSTTNVNSSYSGTSTTVGRDSYGNYYESGSYRGSLNTTSTTTSYDAEVAHQAMVVASDRINDYGRSLLESRLIKEEGYLKKSTLNPGEIISGYVLIEQKKGTEMDISISINGISYLFPWNVGEK